MKQLIIILLILFISFVGRKSAWAQDEKVTIVAPTSEAAEHRLPKKLDSL